MKLNPVGGAWSAMPELNWMDGPESGVTTHSCCPGSTVVPMVKTVVQLKSTTSPGDAQVSLGTVCSGKIHKAMHIIFLVKIRYAPLTLSCSCVQHRTQNRKQRVRKHSARNNSLYGARMAIEGGGVGGGAKWRG